MFRNILVCIILSGSLSCASHNFIPDNSNRRSHQYVDKRSEPRHKQLPSEKEEILKVSTPKKIHIEDLLRIAKLCNPEISSAENAFRAAEGRVHQAGLLPNFA